MISDQRLGRPLKMKFAAAVRMVLTDAQGKILETNSSFVKTLGYAPQEIYGWHTSSRNFRQRNFDARGCKKK